MKRKYFSEEQIIGILKEAEQMRNEGVIGELHAAPHGERAQAIILTLPSGRMIPINYLRDGNTIYGAADFPWWREFPEE